jgi:hypothetical protein
MCLFCSLLRAQYSFLKLTSNQSKRCYDLDMHCPQKRPTCLRLGSQMLVLLIGDWINPSINSQVSELLRGKAWLEKVGHWGLRKTPCALSSTSLSPHLFLSLSLSLSLSLTFPPTSCFPLPFYLVYLLTLGKHLSSYLPLP